MHEIQESTAVCERTIWHDRRFQATSCAYTSLSLPLLTLDAHSVIKTGTIFLPFEQLVQADASG